jgi:hypothetical protein
MSTESWQDLEARLGKFDEHRPAVLLSTGERLSEGQLRDLQSDPRYWRAGDTDPAYRAWVDQLFATAYPGGQRRVP